MKTLSRSLLLVLVALLAGCLDTTAPRIPTDPSQPSTGKKKTGYAGEIVLPETRPPVRFG